MRDGGLEGAVGAFATGDDGSGASRCGRYKRPSKSAAKAPGAERAEQTLAEYAANLAECTGDKPNQEFATLGNIQGSIDDARTKMEEWRKDYNEIRPHSAIGNKPPISLMNGSEAAPPP